MLDFSQIRTLLPHGQPMVLVDRVASLKPGESIIGLKAITGSEACYQGLPPGLPRERYAYPTSLLLESFGQTTAIFWKASAKSLIGDPDLLIMLAAVRDCRIEGRAFPGDVLRHVVRWDHLLGANIFVEGETWVGDRRVVTVGSMIAAARPRSVVLNRASRRVTE